MRSYTPDIKQADITDWVKLVEQLNENIRQSEQAIADAKVSLKEHQDKRDELIQALKPLIAKRELLTAPLAIANTTVAIEKVQLEINQLIKHAEQLQQRHKEIDLKIKITREKINLYEKAQALKDLEAEYNRVNDKIKSTTKTIQSIATEQIATTQEKNDATMRRALAQQELARHQEHAQDLKDRISKGKENFPEYNRLKYKFGGLANDIKNEKDALTQLRIEENANKLRLKESLNDVNKRTSALQELMRLKSKSESLLQSAARGGVTVEPDGDLPDIVSKIAELNNERDNLVKRIQTLEGHIDSRNTKLDEFHHRLDQLNQKKFIAEYVNNPLQLLNSTYDRLNKSINAYRNGHPNLTDHEIEFITEYTEKAKFIVNGERRANESNDSTHRSQKRIQQFYGFIYTHQQKYSAKCNALCNEMLTVLGDDKLDEQEAKNSYADLSLDYNEILDRQPKAPIVRLSDYNQALNNFSSALNDEPENASQLIKDFYTAGKALLSSIREEASKPENICNQHNYVSVLNAATNLLNLENLKEKSCHTALANCTKLKIDGKRSIAKTVIGALLVFAGLAGVVASLLTVTLSSGASLLGAVGGMGILSMGLTLLADAKPTGTAKALANFQYAARKAAYTPKLFGLSSRGKKYASEPLVIDFNEKQNTASKLHC